MSSLRDRASDAWSELRYRFRAVFQRRAMERDLDEELRFHIEHEARKLESSGLAPNEALRQARLAFGGVERIKDDTRDQNGVSWLETFAQDMRYAIRGLRARPAFTASVALTLGLGIGANVAMFAIVDRLVLRPPPYLRDADRVHRIYLTYHDGERDITDAFTEYTRYLDFTRFSKAFDVLAVLSSRDLAIGTGDDAREMRVGTVSASFWSLFDAPPALGRYFTTAEDSIPTGTAVTVLSHALWQTRYGGSPNVLGQTIQIGPVPCTIIGVTPPGFIGVPDEGVPAAYIPATLIGYGISSARGKVDYYTSYSWGWLSVLARRKPNVSVQAATTDLTNAYQLSWNTERTLFKRVRDVSVARPRALAGPVLLERGPTATPVAKVAVWITGVATIVLLIACANVANLLLARAIFRQRELALRLVLGATRRRLASQLITESLILGALGGLVGLAAAQWGGAVFRALFLREAEHVGVVGDVRTMLFAGIAALTAGLLTGVFPALQAGRGALAPTLKTGDRGGTYQRSRTRTALLVMQGALSVVLLVGAGLFVRSLHNVRSLNLGFNADRLVVVDPNLRGANLPPPERAELVRRLVAAARAMPEVASAARGISVPFWSTEGLGFYVPGVDSLIRGRRYTVQMASEDYFTTVGTRIVRGRPITDADRAEGALVSVVSEGMAAELWPGKDAIGQCITLDTRNAPCRTVVGIAENIRQNSLTQPQTLQFYLAIEQLRPEEARVFIRTRGDAGRSVEIIRRQLQRVMPGSGYVNVASMREILDPRQRSWQVGATMFVVFGCLALVLAAVGLYSVIAYGVAQRTREIGVRIALGAGVRDVVRLVIAEGMRFAGVGIVVGAALALWASKWVGPMLFSVSARDPAVYAVVAFVLLVAAMLASAIPSFRATRVDPNVALKAE